MRRRGNPKGGVQVLLVWPSCPRGPTESEVKLINGCFGEEAIHWGRTLNTNASAMAKTNMPVWNAMKDSRGVRATLRSVPVSDRNRRSLGESTRGTASTKSLTCIHWTLVLLL